MEERGQTGLSATTLIQTDSVTLFFPGCFVIFTLVGRIIFFNMLNTALSVYNT